VAKSYCGQLQVWLHNKIKKKKKKKKKEKKKPCYVLAMVIRE
jgi:hypothetical protein